MNDMTPPALEGAPLEFNPLDPAFIADPYPFYRRLRETAPVFKTPQGLWLVTRYDDVTFALRDKRFGKDFVGNLERRYGNLARMDEPAVASLARTMLVLDPPDHTRLRALVTKAFTARRVADMRPRIKALVDAQLDRVIDKGEMDVMRDLAHRLPVIVICDMLGIPEDHRAPFLAGSNVNGRILEPVPMSREELDQANRNTQMAGAYFDQLCELRRREPKDDLTTELVRAEEAGDKLTAEELQANIGLLFGAGHETTTNLIGNGLLALHRHRDQWERLKADPSLIPNAVEELLRYDSRGRHRRGDSGRRRECDRPAGRGQPRPGAISGSRQARCRPDERAALVVRWRHPLLPGRPACAARSRAGLHRPGRAPAQHRIARERRAGLAAELHLAGAEQAAGGVALTMLRLQSFLPNEVGEVSAQRTEGS